MSEYIEREAKIEELKQWVKNNPHATEESKMKVAYGIQLLANIPAADVEPVVRCKKCRYWEVIGTDEDEGFCKFRAGYIGESYYCADGKERER